MAYELMTKRPSLQSQHSSFEDTATVHPLRNLLLSIRDEIEKEATHQMICMCKYQLGDQYEDLVKECNILAFFNVLESKHGTDYAVNFMETSLEHEQQYGDFGSCKLSDQVQQYKKEKAQYLSENPIDPNFIGREDYVAEIIDILQNGTKENLGVLICGESGIGKSSLGRDVCHKHRNNDNHWQIKPINLRGVTTLREFLQALAMQFLDCWTKLDLGTDFLRSKVLDSIREILKYKCIIWLDNIDCLCDNEDEMKGLEDFLNEMVDLLFKDDTCQTKLLVTISTDKPHNVSKHFKNVELGRLSSQVTHQFFRQQSGISEEGIFSGLCGRINGHPLALRMATSSLRNGKYTDYVENYSRDYTESVPIDSGLDNIFETAFLSWDKPLQTLIIKLSVFKTVPFSLENAVCVTGNCVAYPNTSEATNRGLVYNLMAEMTQLRLLNFVEHCNNDQEDDPSSNFSLHPLISRCLQNFKHTDVFIQAKESFCMYFCAKICSFAKQMVCEEQTRVNSYLLHNFHHFKTWFHYVMNDSLPVDKFYGRSHSRPMLLQCRIWRVAQTVLQTSDQFVFLEQQIKLANQSKNWLSVDLWLTFQAEWCIHENQPESAFQMISQVSEKYQILTPEVICNKEDTNKTTSKLHSSLQQIIDNCPKPEVFDVIAVCGFLCKNHGILLRIKNNLLESKLYLKETLRLFSGKTGKTGVSKDICKEMKGSFKYEADKIQTRLSAVRHDLKAYTSDLNTQRDRQQTWLTSRVTRKRSSSEMSVISFDSSIDSSIEQSFDSSIESSFESSGGCYKSVNRSNEMLFSSATRDSKERRLSSDTEPHSSAFKRLESQTSVTSLMECLTTQSMESFDDESVDTSNLNADI